MKKPHRSHRHVPESAPDPALATAPTKLFVEVTTRCNLQCPMCTKQAPGCGIIEGDMRRDVFDRLTPAFAGLEALVLNGIGEPLLHPELDTFIARAKSEMAADAWVGFQTNGQLLTAARAQSLVDAGVDRICFSVDAVSPEIFRAMRTGGDKAMVDTAVELLQTAARRGGRRVSLGVEFVATRHNIEELPPLVGWAARQGVDFVIVTHMLPYHEALAEAAAYDTNTEDALQLFQQGRSTAKRAGIDLDDYFDVFMKYRKTPAERKLVQTVNQMKADALAQGVTLHVERLLGSDGKMLARVGEVFAEAEAIAARTGVALQLPALAPTRQRRCEFVEGGGAFISWEGHVHPCYFLWHRYRCHIGGLVKYVQPQSFGRLQDSAILDIWNAAAFLDFRREVLQYDFPFCYDCSVALCDYTQLAEFEQDCHIGSVPCGACLWCTGLFHCLQ